MRITKFNVAVGESGDDFAKNRFRVTVVYRLTLHRKDREYVHTVPREILDDIGPIELTKRVYSVFKQHIKRSA